MNVFDIQNEMAQAEAWEVEETDETMSVDEIADLASTGISFCQGSCTSRDLVGVHRCYCIRARFPSPEHFELYKEAREDFKRMVAIKVISVALPTD